MTYNERENNGRDYWSEPVTKDWLKEMGGNAVVCFIAGALTGLFLLIVLFAAGLMG